MTYIPQALRRQVIERARGCCEYCLTNQEDMYVAHQIDHVIATRHRGQTTLENLCLSCIECNLNKGSDITTIDEETGDITVLFNPRTNQWAGHFRLEENRIVPLTPQGRVTEFLLGLNSPEQLRRRAELIPLGRYPCR